MEAWQEAFIDAHYRYTVTIKKNELVIEHRHRENTLVFYPNDLEMLYAIFENIPTATIEIKKIMVAYVELYAKHHGHKLIIFDPSHVSFQHEFFHPLGYHEVPDSMDIVTGGYFYKQLAKGSQKQITRKCNQMLDALEEIKRNKFFFVYKLDKRVRFSEISLYYKGNQESITTQYKNNALVWVFHNEHYVIQSNEDMKCHLETILDKMEKKMRLKTQFTLPRKYFDTRMVQFRFNEELLNRIHATLLQYYSWEEIEKYFYQVAGMTLKKQPLWHNGTDIKVFNLMDLYLIMEENKDHVFKKEDRKQALSTFTSLVAKKAVEKAENDFNKAYPI